ncbi:DUF624 domain-containing protein [Clostridium estertheticum]|uniref:YesL family protein n=1 Tax=Clostridium estertheticum TaxID=238834 RepID=UPI0013E95A1A|nr:DUF624 domain-containing protein [Clostridium estertheticum]MBZ9686527.1 DUF624 domain-containing protein [Clostridium estertheticum]
MNGLFSLEGPLYNFCVLVYETFILNLLWLVGSIPIVTMGAATTAVCSVYTKKVKGNHYNIYSDFIQGYKENFKKASLAGTVINFSLLLGIYNVVKISRIGNEYFWLCLLQIFILFHLLLVSLYIFPLIARLDMKLLDIIKNALIISYKNMITSSLNVVLFIAIAVFSLTRPVCFLFLFSGYALFISYQLERILKRNK